MTLDQIARVMGGRLVAESGDVRVLGVSTDTRTLKPGDLFFALVGERDGQAFAAEALERGAAGVVVGGGEARPRIEVADTLKALGDLAAAYRLAVGVKVVAITGSVGKTTTKEMVGHILNARAVTVRAPRSFNNLIGVPLTLLSATERTQYCVLEVGTSRPGEIARLAEIARPDVGVVTSVAEAHLEGLGDLAGVAREKGALLRWLRTGGTAIVNADNPWTRRMGSGGRAVTFGLHNPEATFLAKNVRSRDAWLSFVLDDVPFKVKALSLCNVYNALAAVAIARTLGVPLEECAEALIEYVPPPMRMERVRADGVLFVNDAYNANPVSMRAALASFAKMRSFRKKYAVIGDMRELGPESLRLHREVVRFAAGLRGYDGLIAVGPEMTAAAEFLEGRVPFATFENAEAAAPFVRAISLSGDLVLLKGSRAMAMEKILQHFQAASTVTI